MSLYLITAIAISLFAFGGALVLLKRFEDWRFGFLAAVTTAMTVVVTVVVINRFLAADASLGFSLTGIGTEFDLVILATIALFTVVLMERVIRVRKESERALKLPQFSVERAAISAFWIGPDGSLLYVNECACESLGYRRDELLAKKIYDIDPKLTAESWAEHWASLKRQRTLTIETCHQTKDGRQLAMEVSANYLQLDGKEYDCAFARDITQGKEQQRKLEHQALHDALTGLPNRTLLADRLELALKTAKRDGKPLALLLLDLDRFKEINDTLGHRVGDMLLSEVAKRLKKAIRKSDTIARLGGDEFAALLPAVTDLARAERVAQRIAKALESPFRVLDGLSLEVGVSTGIALYPQHAEDSSKLMQRADVAMYAAKQAQSHIALYDYEKDHNSVRHLTLTGELRQAIEQNQLSFHYQPKIDMQTRLVYGVEALARWHHPKHGYIPPHEFVIQAERTGLIELLTQWSFETALGQLATWRDEGLRISMSVNLSARSLRERYLPDQIAQMLEQWSIPPERLILEITESAIMADPETAMEVVSRLHDIGVQLSIDDFGTGYSSLAYLKRLPMDELKIDQSFVKHMTENHSDLVIVRSTIDLAHNLGLRVVAEGIEQDEQIDALKQLGCEFGQGYRISQALPLDRLSLWLKESEFAVPDDEETADVEEEIVVVREAS